MKKIFRILISALCILLGTSGVAFTIYLFTQGVDVITDIAYISMIAVSLAIIGLGLMVAMGKRVKEALQDIVSGISF